LQSQRHAPLEFAGIGCLFLLHLPIAWLGWVGVILTLVVDSELSSYDSAGLFSAGLVMVPKAIVGAAYASARPARKLQTFATVVAGLLTVDLLVVLPLVILPVALL
jgi:hypothetical protein